jgi:hypothetical protein
MPKSKKKNFNGKYEKLNPKAPFKNNSIIFKIYSQNPISLFPIKIASRWLFNFIIKPLNL